MFRQNQIGTMATMNISTMPTAKRSICGRAQVSMFPPAMEYSIRKPTEATAMTSTTSGQLRYRTLRSPVGACLTRYSRKLIAAPVRFRS